MVTETQSQGPAQATQGPRLAPSAPDRGVEVAGLAELAEIVEVPLLPGDAALVYLVRHGALHCYGDLVQRHIRQVYLAVRASLPDSDACAALVTEVFLAAHRDIDRCKNERDFASWVTRRAVIAALDHRSRLRIPTGDFAVISSEAKTTATGDLGSSDDSQADADLRLRARVEATVASLPAAFRAVFLLKVVGNAKHEQVASALGLGVETVRNRLHRACDQIHRELGRNCEGVDWEQLFQLDEHQLESIVQRIRDMTLGEPLSGLRLRAPASRTPPPLPNFDAHGRAKLRGPRRAPGTALAKVRPQPRVQPPARTEQRRSTLPPPPPPVRTESHASPLG